MNTIGKVPATKQDVETAVEHAIDTLALMINEGFNSTASKEDMTAMEDRLTTRLDRIENLLLEEQKREIEQSSSELPLPQCGTKPTLPRIHQLNQHPGPHGG